MNRVVLDLYLYAYGLPDVMPGYHCCIYNTSDEVVVSYVNRRS